MSNFPDDDDGDTLQGLLEAGVDLTQPRAIEFTVEVKDGEVGASLAAELGAAGYSCHVEYDEGEEGEDDDDPDGELGPAWTLYATVSMVPSYGELLRRQEEIGRLASPFGAVCDGWGTEA